MLLTSLVMVLPFFSAGCSNELSRAAKAEQAGDLTTAVSLYRNRLEASPDDLEAIKALSAILYMEREWDEALPVQERAITLDPNEAQIRVELGFNYLNHQGQAAKAVAVLLEAAVLEPGAKHLCFLAQAQLAGDDQRAAEETLGKALAADKSYGYTYVLLIPLLERQGRTAEAAQLRAAAGDAGVALEALSDTQ